MFIFWKPLLSLYQQYKDIGVTLVHNVKENYEAINRYLKRADM